jgi:hypothetical protein
MPPRHDSRSRRAAAPTTTLRVTGPHDLLQAVPYLVGFHPERSAVFVGLTNGKHRVTARADLDDTLPETAPRTLRAMSGAGVTEIVVVVYGDGTVDGDHPLPHGEVAEQLADEVERAGCVVTDLLLVADGRWYSYRCDVAECCPPEGTPLLLGTSAVAAEAAFAGLVALPDRAALVATFDPAPEADREALRPLLREAEAAQSAALAPRRDQRALIRGLSAAARSADGAATTVPVPDDDLVRWAVGLRTFAVRDPVWVAIDRNRFDGRPLWRELARRLPSPYDAPPLFLYGWAAWRDGKGAEANIAGERAILSDPGYTAADLLLAAISYGIDPRRVPRLRLPRPA